MIVPFDRSMHFKSQTDFIAPFRERMPAISHFSILAFKPEKRQNWLKLLISSLNDGISIKKKVELSA